eukprot:gene35781-43399_t
MQHNLFLSFYFIWTAVSQPTDISYSEQQSAVSFLLLGDWGKGGTTGSMGSSADDDNELQAPRPNSTLTISSVRASDPTNSHDRRKEDKESKVSYQVQVAKEMAQYAASASPAPSSVLALGDNFYNNGVSSSTD